MKKVASMVYEEGGINARVVLGKILIIYTLTALTLQQEQCYISIVQHSIEIV